MSTDQALFVVTASNIIPLFGAMFQMLAGAGIVMWVYLNLRSKQKDHDTTLDRITDLIEAIEGRLVKLEAIKGESAAHDLRLKSLEAHSGAIAEIKPLVERMDHFEQRFGEFARDVRDSMRDAVKKVDDLSSLIYRAAAARPA